jgi:hypothetical protein
VGQFPCRKYVFFCGGGGGIVSRDWIRLFLTEH